MDKEKVKDLIQEIREEIDYINRSSDDAKDLLVELEEEIEANGERLTAKGRILLPFVYCLKPKNQR